MEALLETKIFKVSVERLLLNGGQTLYMVGIALLIGTVIGTLLALVLVLCRKGGLVENKVLHSIVSLYINVVRSVPFIILLVTIMPLTRAILGTTIGSTAALVPLVMNTPLMIVTVIALVILVQLLQMAGNRVSRRLREHR